MDGDTTLNKRVQNQDNGSVDKMAWQKCPYCNGTGKEKGKKKLACKTCGGSGKYLINEPKRGIHTVDWESR
jgi:DnaJ-class molecular chaperone